MKIGSPNIQTKSTLIYQSNTNMVHFAALSQQYMMYYYGGQEANPGGIWYLPTPASSPDRLIYVRNIHSGGGGSWWQLQLQVEGSIVAIKEGGLAAPTATLIIHPGWAYQFQSDGSFWLVRSLWDPQYGHSGT